MFSLVFALALVSQTPDFSSVAPARIIKVVKTDFAGVDEIPPTAEIEYGCKCGCNQPDCNCEKCVRMLELQSEVKRLILENAKLKTLKQALVKENLPTAEIGESPRYYMRDKWGYEWNDTDNENLVRYVNDLNNGVAGHPHYNEIILRHQSRVVTRVNSIPSTSSFNVSVGSAGGCSGGSCSVGNRGLFGGFR